MAPSTAVSRTPRARKASTKAAASTASRDAAGSSAVGDATNIGEPLGLALPRLSRSSLTDRVRPLPAPLGRLAPALRSARRSGRSADDLVAGEELPDLDLGVLGTVGAVDRVLADRLGELLADRALGRLRRV